MRPHLPSYREDPRREPSSPIVEPSPDDHFRRVVHQLATAELQRAQEMPKVMGYLKSIAEAVTVPAGRMREKSDSRLELEAEVLRLKDSIIKEVVSGESIRAKAMLQRWTGAAFIEAARQLWRARVQALILSAVVGLVCWGLRGCQSLPTPAALRPAPAAAHP